MHPFRASFITRVNAEKKKKKKKKKIDLSAPHGTLRVPLDAPKSNALSKASTNKFNFKTGYSRASSLGNRLLSTPISRGAHFFFLHILRQNEVEIIDDYLPNSKKIYPNLFFLGSLVLFPSLKLQNPVGVDY